MAKGYMGETRYYLMVLDNWEIVDGSRVAQGEPNHIRHDGEITDQFIDAKHFESFEEAKTFGEQFKQEGRTIIVASLHLAINGFDVGTII